MQGKKGQISPSSIVWVAWNTGSRLFFGKVGLPASPKWVYQSHEFEVQSQK
jgi:hypothetical protein